MLNFETSRLTAIAIHEHHHQHLPEVRESTKKSKFTKKSILIMNENINTDIKMKTTIMNHYLRSLIK